MQQKLESIFRQAFGIDHLTDEMSIDTVDGWDSMAHVALILALQSEFHVDITPADALDLTDVASIKKYLQKRAS